MAKGEGCGKGHMCEMVTEMGGMRPTGMHSNGIVNLNCQSSSFTFTPNMNDQSLLLK